MNLSALIVSYNVERLLARCLQSLLHSSGLEVIVVDNASSDDTLHMVRRDFPAVRLDPQPTNLGFSRAVNRAASLAAGDTFLILNPDTELPDGSVAAMHAALQRQPDAWVMGFRQVDEQNRFQLVASRRPTLCSEMMRRFVQRRIDRGGLWIAGLVDRVYSRVRPVDWVSASVMMTHRFAFEALGGFDERFFLYFEDVDFCLRAQTRGGRVYYDPSVTLVHHRGASRAYDSAAVKRAYRESQVYFAHKHLGSVSRLLLETSLRLRGQYPGGV